MKNTKDLQSLVAELHDLLIQKNLCLSVAESCTGGLLAAYLTATPGCSLWFDRGFVTYSNLAKQEMLGVSATLLDKFGAVSKEVVCAMAEGAVSHSGADVTIAISGIAGPGGGSLAKPVGTVWLAFAYKERIFSQSFVFAGDRAKVREQAVLEALIGVIGFVKSNSM